jgi:hypothetical protein
MFVNPIQRMGFIEIARPAVLRRRVPKPPSRKCQPRATSKPRHGFWRFGNDADAEVWCNAVPVGKTSGCDALPLRSNRIAGGYAVIGFRGKCCAVAASSRDLTVAHPKTRSLIKGASFYLLLLGGLAGFLLSGAAKVSDETKIALIGIAALSTLVTSLIALVLTLGYLSGLKGLESSYKKLNPTIFYELKINLFFRRGYIAVLTGILCCVALALILTFGFYIDGRGFRLI